LIITVVRFACCNTVTTMVVRFACCSTVVLCS
jgi:hypothetical protein